MVNILTEQNVHVDRVAEKVRSPALAAAWYHCDRFRLVGDAINIGAATARQCAGAVVLALSKRGVRRASSSTIGQRPTPIGDRDHLADVRVSGVGTCKR